MIEAMIYALGAAVIILTEITILIGLSYLLVNHMVVALAKRLKSLYLHAQLRHFMGKLMDKGISSLRADAERMGYRVMDKDLEP